MTAKQYLAAIERLGLSQTRAGVFFGYSPRTGQRWASGETEIPAAVDYCIRLMLKHGTHPGMLNKEFLPS